MKKKQQAISESASQLNATFLIKLVKISIESKTVNVEMLNVFSNFLQFIGDNLHKQGRQIDPQILKIIINIIVAVQRNIEIANQNMDISRLEPIFRFLEATFDFADKVFTFEAKPNKDKVLQIVDIFWPLIKNSKKQNAVIDPKGFDKITSFLETMENIPHIYEIETLELRMSSEKIVQQYLGLGYCSEEEITNFPSLFMAALSQYNDYNRNFIESLLNYLESVMCMNSSKSCQQSFQKGLNILLNITNSIGDKYNYIQIFFNRIIKSTNMIRNFVYALKPSDTGIVNLKIQKFYSNDHLLSLSLIVLQKIITFRTINSDLLDALNIIAKLSQNWMDIESIQDSKLTPDLIRKMVAFVLSQKSSQNNNSISSLSQIFDGVADIGTNSEGLNIFQNEEIGEMNEKVFEFIKSYKKKSNSNNNNSNNNEIQMQNQNNTHNESNGEDKLKDMTKLIKVFTTIITNMTKSEDITKQIKIENIQALQNLYKQLYPILDNPPQKISKIKVNKEQKKEIVEFIIDICSQLLSQTCFRDLLTILYSEQGGQQRRTVINMGLIKILTIKKLEKLNNLTVLKQTVKFESLYERLINVYNDTSQNNKQEQVQKILQNESKKINQPNVASNFDLVVFYMYLKRINYLQESDHQIEQKQKMLQIIIERTVLLLQKLNTISKEKQVSEKLSKQLKIVSQQILISQVLIIIISQQRSGSHKFNLKSVLKKNIHIVPNKLNIHQFITWNSKQVLNGIMRSGETNLILLNKDKNNTIDINSQFIKLVRLFNQVSTLFEKYILKKDGNSQEDKQNLNLKVLLQVKFSTLGAELTKNDKSYTVPQQIKNINSLKRNNAISSLDLVLLSFSQHFQESQNNDIINNEGHFSKQDSLICFHYLLKILIQLNNNTDFQSTSELQNPFSMELEGEEDNQQKRDQEKIFTYEMFNSTINETLLILKNKILAANRKYSLDMLIKFNEDKQNLFSQKQQRYLDYICDGQIIKFISEMPEDNIELTLEFTYLSLIVFKRLITKKDGYKTKIKNLKDKIQKQNKNKIIEENQQKDQQAQISQPQINQLDQQLKKINLLYFPFESSSQQMNLSKVRIQTVILTILGQSNTETQKLQRYSTIYNSIIQHLSKNMDLLNQVIIQENKIQQQGKQTPIWNFTSSNQYKFTQHIFNFIFQLFSESIIKMDQHKIDYFNLVYKILENKDICQLAQKQIGSMLSEKIQVLIDQRITTGLKMVENFGQSNQGNKIVEKGRQATAQQHRKQVKVFVETSQKLYNVIYKIINPEQTNNVEIINKIISKDQFKNIESTQFLIQEIQNISQFLGKKCENLTQSIFSYIMKVNQTYTTLSKKSHLQIPEFICDFFKITNKGKSESQLKNIQKVQRAIVCSNNPTYKCLKCDQKRLICYGCMIKCHEGHPVIYTSEIKQAKCLCRDAATGAKCALGRQSEEGISKDMLRGPPNSYGIEKRGISGRMGRNEYFYGDEDKLDIIPNIQAYDDQEYFNETGRLINTGGMGGRMIRKAQNFGLQSSEIANMMNEPRGENPFMSQLDGRFEPIPKNTKLKQDQNLNNNKVGEQDFTFDDQKYEDQQTNKIDEEKVDQTRIQSQISSQSYLLPVFLQMFNQLYSGTQKVSVQKVIYDYEKIAFEGLTLAKIMNSSWKATNPNSYNVRLRKQNHLNGKSPSVSKHVIAQNSKFILIASGSMISVHLKERFLLHLLEGKNTGSFINLHQHSVTFDVHTIDFSPFDEYSFCVAGLHTIINFTINGQGIITRTNLRVNVNNDYINKMRLSKLGVFYGTSNEIRLLNWSFKQVLSIKSPSQSMLKQWCVYEKKNSGSNNCTLYCVNSHGSAEFIDLSSSDEGRKMFTSQIIDGRKSFETGASILVKDVEKAGKVLLASYKDGNNLIGNLEGDTVNNPSHFQIRNVFTEIFAKKFIFGQTEIIKGGENQFFVLATIKQQLNSQNSAHQGQLVVFKIKNGKCEFHLIHTDQKCQFFTVVNIGDQNWSVISLHDDGSLVFSTLNKLNKQQIQAQSKRIKEIQPVASEKNAEKTMQIKHAIAKTLKAQFLSQTDVFPIHSFREFSDLLKINTEYKVINNNENYEIKLLSPNKVLTGISLPFLGNIYLPNRTVKNVVQVGLSNLQILHYFSEGSLKFRVQKIQSVKNIRETMNYRFMEKLDKLQKLHELSLDSEKASQLLNSLKQSQAASDDVIFYGVGIQSFKNRIPKFNQIFTIEQKEDTKDKNLQKMAIILKIFIQNSIENQNFLCQPFQIIDFVKNLRELSLAASQQTYQILKDLIIISLKMYQKITQTKLHVFNDQFYPLKYATEDKADHYYMLLKTQINDNQLQEILDFFNSICQDDLSVLIFYLSKYPSLLAKIQKKSKKIQKQKISQIILKMYVIGYQVLKFKSHSCQWILQLISLIFGLFPKSESLRKSFYHILKSYGDIKVEGWTKNVLEVDGQQIINSMIPENNPPPVQEQNFGGGGMNDIYGQFGMGQMDQEAMIRMAIQMSEAQFKQNQQIPNFPEEPIEQEKQNMPQEQLMMQKKITNEQQVINKEFLVDLIDQCFKDNTQINADIAKEKLTVLYIIGRHIVQTKNQETERFYLNKIKKFLIGLSPNCENYNKHILMGFFSVFSNFLTNTRTQMENHLQSQQIYSQIKRQVLDRLQKVQPQKVTKLTQPPCLLKRIFKGQKLYTFAHYAYGLVSLLLPPCEPNHTLLSLQCYWLLPESKQHYTKMKHMTTIRQGINAGNIDKLFEVAHQHPDIWRQCADIEWIENWIGSNKQGWEKALNLLTLYYNEQ